ncbi:DUF4954 domain-containing protein [Bacteroidia bacterium]|nr:DUF4954 domain-containing protein [Bacteroidia bacterium]
MRFMKVGYRNLTPQELSSLEERGNRAEDWMRIEVAERFTAASINGCYFKGDVRLGCIEGMVATPEGELRPAMLHNACLVDCTVDDRVIVNNIHSPMMRCDVGSGVFMEDVGVVQCTGQSTFGGGVRVAVINEVGGREVPLFEGMTAQIAYMMALYRHRPRLIEALERMIARSVEASASRRMSIGEGAMIRGVGELTDVKIGRGASILGARSLRNGAIGENARVGTGVMAHDFVFAREAILDTGATLRRTFVGEGTTLEDGFTASDSLLFACSVFACGEAVSIFAGPFTVSHHRSSLLIAGIFSFFNAGSGANQSNHLFKTGPVHQGVHLRGGKMASNACVMLPAREGAFTMTLGRHTSHHDTRDFPFSYLIEEEGRSYLMPGANLRSYGTLRDVGKWPRRDRRTGERRDKINYQPYNPYLGEAIRAAIRHSERLLEQPAEVCTFRRVRIRQTMLRRGLALYRKAWQATLFAVLAGCKGEADEAGCGPWVDMGGMYAPRSVVEGLCDAVERGEVASIEELYARICGVFDAYDSYARGWAMSQVEGDLGQCMREGEAALEALEAMAAEDARRDDDNVMMTGYGIDSTEEDCDVATDDFLAVRKR